MNFRIFYQKIIEKLRNKLINITRNSRIYPFIYRSYWHFLIFRKPKAGRPNNYYAAIPNQGAGIGHQLANWIAGYWYAKQFDLGFVHIPFSTEKWEYFLGFGEEEKSVDELKKIGYKVRKLPLFRSKNTREMNLNRSIIESYNNKKIIFLAGQDQGYQEQYGVIEFIRKKFNTAQARLNERIIYNQDYFNIAVHVRRTVIIDSKVIIEDEIQRSKRWLSNDYYEKVLKKVLLNLDIKKPIRIFIFSTSKAHEFEEFSKYGDVRFCSDMDEYASFLHLIKADLLITSKSSFSYKPALISEGIKICPKNFWHGYPTSSDFILVDNEGDFNHSTLKKALKDVHKSKT